MLLETHCYPETDLAKASVVDVGEGEEGCVGKVEGASEGQEVEATTNVRDGKKRAGWKIGEDLEDEFCKVLPVSGRTGKEGTIGQGVEVMLAGHCYGGLTERDGNEPY